jgi:hypothetical protein
MSPLNLKEPMAILKSEKIRKVRSMPKRNSTDDAINALNDADKAAAERKAEVLAAIPDPTFVGSIPFVNVYASQAFNVRDAESYGYSANKALYHSLKEHGLEKRGDMMSFSIQPDGRLFTLVGNLRHNQMVLIRREMIEAAAKDGRTIPDEELPFANIFGLVYRGLTHNQEVALMCDHALRKALNEFEMSKEIGELMERTGMTDAKASIHFGMDKNKVRRLRMRYCMPTVLGEYRKEKSKDKDVSFIKIGNEQLDALYTAYLSDRDMGCAHREEGPSFKRAWQVVISNPEAFKRASKDAGPEAKDRKKLLDAASSLAANFGDSPEIAALAKALHWGGGDEIALITVASDLQEYVRLLIKEKEAYAEQLLFVTSERDHLIDENHKLSAECNSLTSERDELLNVQRTLSDNYTRLEDECKALKATTAVNGRRKSSK